MAMQRWFGKTKGLIRGVPTAVLLSVLVHFILLIVAGGVVIFTVVLREEKRFTPPEPVDRPQMELRRPRVRVQPDTRQATVSRITAETTVQTAPDMQLADISLAGAGLDAGIGGFEMMPDPSEMTLFGAARSFHIGNDFEGTFYALGLDRSGRRNDTSMNSYWLILRRFYDSGWNPLALAEYYRWPQKLYTTFFYTPMTASEHVPRSFGVPDDIWSFYWMAHYRGQMMSAEGGRYRFWGRAETLMAVRVDGREVGHFGHISGVDASTDWQSTAPEHRKFWRGHGPMAVGDWFELKPGEPVPMEVVIGNHNGAWTQSTLTIEKEGVSYRRNRDGYPILPIFKTAEIPQHLQDEIRHSKIEGEATFQGPTYNVF